MTRIFGLLLAGAVATAAPTAQALTGDFNFTSGGTITGQTGTFTSTNGLLTVKVKAINTESPPTPTLYRSDFGLGVTADCPSGGGDFCDELDNLGDDEAIVFDFGIPASFSGAKLTLAALDDNYEFYGSNNAAVLTVTTGGRSSLTSISELIASGNGFGLGGGVVDVPLSSLKTFQFLIAMTPGGAGFFSDGYKIKGLTGVSPIPVPAALPLLASGVACFAWLRRTKRRQAA